MKNIFTLILATLLSFKICSQEYDSTQINGYYIILSYTDSICHPHIYSGILTTLDSCRVYTNDIDSIIRNFYECAVFIDDPLISLESCKTYYKNSIDYEQAYNSTFNLVLKKFHKLSTKCIIKYSHHIFLNITAIKLSGRVWVIRNNNFYPNGSNYKYILPDYIYPKSYYYGLNHIKNLNKLNKSEKKVLIKMFSGANGAK